MSGEFKVDRVERKKEGEKGPSLKLPPSKKNFIVAAILYIAKKFVDLYEKNFKKWLVFHVFLLMLFFLF